MALRLIERIRGPRLSTTVPPLDGPWTPNDGLEGGQVIFADDRLVDAVLIDGDRLAVLTDASVIVVDPVTGSMLDSVDLPGRATAMCGAPGGLLVSLEDRGLHGLESSTLEPSEAVGRFAAGLPTKCVTAMAIAPDGSLWLTQGSRERPIDDWKRDLLTRGSSGSVWRATETDSLRVADGLAWPAGIYADAGRVVVSEAWRHRLVAVQGDGTVSVVLDDLPAYPTQITPDGSGTGFALACSLPRSSLVEFVINEEKFVQAMVGGLDERAWVVPQLGTLRHPLEQVQGGELLVFGQVKPWAPTRSYGLAALMDVGMNPLQSLHSRANGRRHGISRVIPIGEKLIVVSLGAKDVSLVHVPRRTHVSL